MRSTMSAGQSNVRSYMSSLSQLNLFPRLTEADNLFDPSYSHIVGDTCD